jgi:hypothetical protein
MVAASSVNLKQKIPLLVDCIAAFTAPAAPHPHQSQSSKKARHQAGL